MIVKLCGFILIAAGTLFSNQLLRHVHERIEPSPPMTLLISCDGFRADYLDSVFTPNLDQLSENGIRANALLPVFPTKTFPNHYSMVTGLYPEDHGIVANRMYDPVKKTRFRIGTGSTSTREAYWFEGEPIWVTAKKQGLRTATLFWPGSDAAPEGFEPDYHYVYDNRLSYQKRIEQVVEWLALPKDQRPHFMTLYFESPDKEGHAYGPMSIETRKAVQQVDHYIGMLMSRISDLNLSDEIHVLVTSDHGMCQLSRDRVIFLDDYISLADISLIETSPKADIIPKHGLDSIIYQKLKNAHPHLSVFRKSETPLRWHHRNHPRITPLTAVADLGWSISTRTAFARKSRLFLGGSHGYDNTHPEMWAIFIGCGPAFKKALVMPEFSNIHLYELMCHLLQIEPAENNGDLSVFKGFLEDF